MNPLLTVEIKGWKKIRLRYCIESVQSGIWGDEPGIEEDDVVCVRVADFFWDRLMVSTSNLTIRSVSNHQLGKHELREGDLLLEKSGGGENQPVGRIVRYTLKERAVCSNFVSRIRPSKDVTPRYLAYLLASLYLSGWSHQFIKQNTGIQNLDEQGLLDTWLQFPPTPEQVAIADFLDRETARIDDLIERKERFAELVGEKIEAVVSRATEASQVENCEERKLGSLVTRIGSGRTPRGGADVYVDSGVALLRSQNIHNDGLRLAGIAYIPHETDSEMAGTRVQAGDVLLNITGASLGRCAVATPDVMPANVNQHVCIIRPSPSIISEYLHLSILSRKVQSQIRLEAFSGNRDGLNFSEVRSLVICVPAETSEQQRIVQQVEHQRSPLLTIIERTRESIARLHEFRAALITAAVTGQIDVATWSRQGAIASQLDAAEQSAEGG